MRPLFWIGLLVLTQVRMALVAQHAAQPIPAGYIPKDSARADFNADGLPDRLVLFQYREEEAHPDTARLLVVYLGKPGGGWIESGRNSKVVFCRNCGGMLGDPYVGLSVKGRFFSVDQYGGSAWRWSRHTTFRFDPRKKDFVLHRDGGEFYHVIETKNPKTELVQRHFYGKRLFREYDPEEGK